MKKRQKFTFFGGLTTESEKEVTEAKMKRLLKKILDALKKEDLVVEFHIGDVIDMTPKD